ncbi:MAG: bifunctional alpha/beta hydrolase/class I SAM-dependent methyltransferase [bacterium]
MNTLVETPHTFRSWDDAELFYRAWQPACGNGKAVIVLHRGHEHSGRLGQLVTSLNLEGFACFAYDMRGHGQSEGERGYADSYDVWVKDLNAFINHIRDEYGIAPENMALVANSVGAVTAVTWIHDYGVTVRCLVLAAPAFRIRLYIPFAIPLLRMLRAIKPKAFITSYVRSGMLTHDPAEARAYDADPLITRKIAVSVLIGLHDTATRILSDAGAITVPTLLFTPGTDYVVDGKVQARFLAAISSTRKEQVTFPGMFHAVFSEINRNEATVKSREFILSCFKDEVPGGLLNADKAGYTRQEYDALKAPAGLLKRAFFGLQVLALRTVGRLSQGVSTGWATGFNSGASLDHVYRNQAEGRTVLGRLIDRGYLNAVGWRGIRIRKDNLQYWIRHAAKRLEAEGRPVRIMDIASGPGRYLLELKRELGDSVAVLLRDREQANLDKAGALAAEWKLANVQCVVADAFDPKSYERFTFRPNIVVVSGLYELFGDNDKVRASLKGIAASMETGGYLIFTGQPWHPQIELIARTLFGSDGEPWVMRRRTQCELNALVAATGFTRMDSRIDPFGIFTVSLARRVA